MTQLRSHQGSQAVPASGVNRQRIVTVLLLIATLLVGYLCYLVILPFLPALAWALALAVIAHPMHRAIRRRIGLPNLAAALSVVIVALVVVGPVAFVTQLLIREVASASREVQNVIANDGWHKLLEKNHTLKSAHDWWQTRSEAWFHGKEDAAHSEETKDDTSPGTPPASPLSAERATDIVAQGVGTVLSGGAAVVFQLLITLMTLFFFFRDRHLVLDLLRSLLPISGAEVDEVFTRIDDTIHATIYGSLVVALIQGTMGGLMFWWLGLPSPLLWGSVMAVLAVVPVLGTFIIWAPTAVWLAISGEWTKALILAGWGGFAIGTIDNFIYPYLVGHRMQFHTLLVFFAIVGGIALFGACGVILGPVILAIADALIDIWRKRMASLMTPDRGIG